MGVNINAQDVDIRDIHHLALVVEDLDDGMSNYSEMFGLSWADPWTGPIPILFGGTAQEPIISFTLSCEGPPHIELIQSTVHEVWQPMEGWHHVGFWTNEIEAAVEKMRRRDFVIEVTSPTADFAYLRTGDGSRIELVHSRSQVDFDRWLKGGQL